MKAWEWIVIPNWDEFQHYRDRDPKWIKVYNSLLNKAEYLDLSSHRRAVLHGIWLLYAASNARVPHDTRSLSRRLQVRVTSTDLRSLVDGGWIQISTIPEKHSNDWASRYVSKEMRVAVLKRDGDKCVICGSTKPLEIDHVLAISKGGGGELENLQTLCRPCNRSKSSRDSVSHLSSVGLPRGREEKEKDLPTSYVVELPATTEGDGFETGRKDQPQDLAALVAQATPQDLPF